MTEEEDRKPPAKRDAGEPSRWQSDASGVEAIGAVTDVEDHTSAEQRERNAKAAEILAEARAAAAGRQGEDDGDDDDEAHDEAVAAAVASRKD